jgi:capsid portal protein
VAADGDRVRVELVKLDGGARPLASNALAEKARDALGWEGTGAIPPPHDPDDCWAWFSASPIIRPNVDALAVNKHGFGYRLVPEIDLQAKDADEQIRVSIIAEKLARGDLPSVTPEETAGRRAQIEIEAPIEKAQVEANIRNLGGDVSFMSLCIKTSRRMEVAGNAYWEILRDQARVPARATLLSETTVRLCRRDTRRSTVERRERVSPIAFRDVSERVHLRKYVQLQDGAEKVWFKEMDDSRIMSSATGNTFASEAAMREAEPGVDAATEILHFKSDMCDVPTSDYGVPRWLGAIRGVVGTRWSEEANEQLLSDGGYPDGFIAVSGGHAAEDLAEQVKNFIRERRDSREAWRPMVLTATGAAGTVDQGRQGATAKITWVPLRDPQTDAMFQAYEEKCARKVQQQYRLPDIMVGRSEESNKAQADAARDMAEEQVFVIERAAFDATVNRLLQAMGVRYWRFVSNGPKTTDPPVVVEMIAKLCAAGVITPHEARELAMDALGSPLDRSWAAWKGLPLEYAKLGYQPPSDPTIVLTEEEVEARKLRPFVPMTAELVKQGMTVDGFREAMGWAPLEDAELGALLLAQVAPEKPEPPAPPPGAGAPFGKKPGGLEEAVKGLVEARSVALAIRDHVEGELLEKARAAQKTAEHVEVDDETWSRFFPDRKTT